MRPCLIAVCLAVLPVVTLADSVRTIEVVNDTRSRIDSFAMAPAGSNHWVEMSFKAPMQESSFDYEVAFTMAFRDDDGCLRDLRTVLSDGRRIFARNFDLCHFHAYYPGKRFYGGHPGSQIMP
jgi:hypothetical protein